MPTELAEVTIEALPADLALTRSDLPAGFQLVTEQSKGAEYLALYVRPTALEEGESGGNRLLSVLTSVGVYTTTLAAEEEYRATAAGASERAVAESAMLGKGATNVSVVPSESAVQGTDEAEAFRVTFELMGRAIYEYGHCFRVGNVLAYVVVSGIGDPEEPERLLLDTRNLVQRQIGRIEEAARR